MNLNSLTRRITSGTSVPPLLYVHVEHYNWSKTRNHVDLECQDIKLTETEDRTNCALLLAYSNWGYPADIMLHSQYYV